MPETMSDFVLGMVTPPDIIAEPTEEKTPETVQNTDK
jgi:hypothetical protein